MNYEFGPFRLDASRRLLYRDLELVGISPKAVDTLIALVRNHGQLSEKEALIREIWPDTVVEESNLAIQISNLRKLLGEAMSPDPIATVPRRGYRFVAPVRELESPQHAVATAVNASTTPAAPASPDSPSVPAAPPIHTLAAENGGAAPASAPAVRRRLLKRIVAAALLTLSVALFALWHGRRAATVPPTGGLTDKDSVLLADVQNETQDALLDTTLRQALTVQLEQSPFLKLISDQQIDRSLSMMKQPRGTRLTRDVAWEVCQRTGSAAVIYGSIATLANQYVFGLRAENCRTGDSIGSEQTTASDKEHVLRAVDDAATALRARLGESLTQIQSYHTPIEQATTASLPALQAYSQGWAMNYARGDPAGAIAFFQRAIDLDPEFAMAEAAFGQTFANLHEPGLAAKHLRRAYELRARVSERERFYIESRYERAVTGDLEKARLINRQWAQIYPRDPLPEISLGLIDRYLGQYERGLTEALSALRLSPDSAQSYANLAFSYLLLNRVPEARATADEAQQKGLDSPLMRLDLYFQAYLNGDAGAADGLLAWATGQSGLEDRFLADKSLQLAHAGQHDKAWEFARRAIESALRAGEKETAAGYEGDWGVFEALVGNDKAARHHAVEARKLSDDRDSAYSSALALALAGDEAEVAPIVEALRQAYPSDTAVQFCYLPTIQAALALRQRDAAHALELLETTRPYELGKVTDLFPVYLRGQAYLAEGRAEESAREYQKIMALPGVVYDDPMGTLTHLQLARAYALRRDSPLARQHYEQFLRLWQDADPLPPLLAARSELAHLQQAPQ